MLLLHKGVIEALRKKTSKDGFSIVVMNHLYKFWVNWNISLKRGQSSKQRLVPTANPIPTVNFAQPQSLWSRLPAGSVPSHFLSSSFSTISSKCKPTALPTSRNLSQTSAFVSRINDMI